MPDILWTIDIVIATIILFVGIGTFIWYILYSIADNTDDTSW